MTGLQPPNGINGRDLMPGAIDLRARPPAGEFLQQRMFTSPGAMAAKLRRRGYEIPPSVKQRSLPLFFEEMTRAGVETAVLAARAPNDLIGGTSNESVAELVRAHPDRFLGIGSLRLTPADAEVDLDTCQELGFIGVAVEPGMADPPMHADDPDLYPIYEQIDATGLPVFVTGGDANPDISYAFPAALDRVARDFPNLEVVSVHGGWPFVTETLGVAWRRPNFWVMPDLYWANLPGRDDYTLAANGFLMDRMLFATSYPAVNVEQYVTSLKSAGLSEAAWQAISADNPRRLLGLG